MNGTTATSSSSSSSSSLHYGRQRIILDYDEVTPQNVIEVLEKAEKVHSENESDCEYLINYVLGKQDILNRSASETSNVNNKVVINYAYPTTREIVGYTLGNPIEFIAKKIEKKDAVQNLNDAYDYEELYQTDINAETYASVCGVGYYITLPSEDISQDNTPLVPLKVDYLDPRTTFVVQGNKIGNPQIMSATRFKNDDTGDEIYNCYTNKYFMVVTNKEKVESIANPIGKDPITMLENSLFLTGDWELAIPAMNASNIVASDSLNDIEGTIRSLLVVLGAQFDDDESDTTLANVKKNRLLQLFAPNGGNVDAKFISPQLDSTSVANIRKYLDDVRNIITGIPNRENANNGGGDTGTAVLNRNGWTDLEIVAKLKELSIKKAKKRQVEVGIEILKKLGIVPQDLTALDIDVTLNRHSMDNLSSRASVFSTLVATGELAIVDCLELSGLTNRVNEMVERGKKEKEERAQTVIGIAEETTEELPEDDEDLDKDVTNIATTTE